MRAHVKFLSSDLLEGRGVGTRGGELATAYIASQFAVIGAKPAGDNGTYFQRVPMVGVTTSNDATLEAVGANKTVSFKWLDDFVGVSETAAARRSVRRRSGLRRATASSRPNFIGTISRAST